MNVVTHPSSKPIGENLLIGANGLSGNLRVPKGAIGLVIFVDECTCRRRTMQNQFLANVFRSYKLGTLQLSLLTDEELRDHRDGVDASLLGLRLIEALFLLGTRRDLARLPIGLFGAGTGAAAALNVAALAPERISAVVSCAGRPHLAMCHLPHVKAPTLLIASGADPGALDFNHRSAFEALRCRKHLAYVPDTTCKEADPQALDLISSQAAHWFEEHLILAAACKALAA